MHKKQKKFLFTTILLININLVFAEVYKENAVVSYYAGDFNGKKTSNGELFNMNDFTCASKNLPFDTILKVTNLANGLSVNVRVNDRGPFVVGRELDLSKAAAKKIDMITSGTANVRIEIIKKGPDTKLSQQTAAKASQIMAKKTGESITTSVSVSNTQKNTGLPAKNRNYATGTLWDIQIGAYSTRESANKVAQKLLQDGFEEVVFQKGNDIYRVVIRSVPAEQVHQVEKKLKTAGYSEYVIRQRKAK